MMPYRDEIKNEAIRLRKTGFSLGEIASRLKIAKSTISLWLKSTPLDPNAIIALQNKRLQARTKGLNTIKQLRSQKIDKINQNAKNLINSFDFSDRNLCKLLCSILYWGEGNKTGYRTAFINSDPAMIITFLKLLRRSFNIDEKKLRALIHIHEYHNDRQMKKYWSDLTSIPLNQFTKSYLKSHTQKVKRPGYKGALRISYYDASIVNELKAIYNTLANQI